MKYLQYSYHPKLTLKKLFIPLLGGEGRMKYLVQEKITKIQILDRYFHIIEFGAIEIYYLEK